MTPLKVVFRLSDGGTLTFHEVECPFSVEGLIDAGYCCMLHEGTLVYINWDHVVGLEVSEVKEQS